MKSLVKFCSFCGKESNIGMTGNVLPNIVQNPVSVIKIWIKRIFKILLIGALVLIMIGAIVVFVNIYNERPQPVNKLGVISLGMLPLDVTLALGKPDLESNLEDGFDQQRFIYNDYSNVLEYFIRFSNDEGVDLICSRNLYLELFGISTYSNESQIIDKLGAPSHTSIRKDGLAKTISYDKFKVAFEIEKNQVVSICVTASGKVEYLEEFDQGMNTETTLSNDNKEVAVSNGISPEKVIDTPAEALTIDSVGTANNFIDSDNDGLTNYEEMNIYLTNPYLYDTDGDTFSDGAEAANGFNPNGSGALNN